MKLTTRLKKAWKAETPHLAKLFQVVSGALAALPLYYASLPVDFQQAVPQNWLKWIAGAGFAGVFLFNFFSKKEKVA